MFEAFRADANTRAEFSHDFAKLQPVADPGHAFDEPVRTIAPGQSASGVIDNGNDVDYFNIELVAGETYLISLVGSGGGPIPDTYLSLASGGTVVAADDDGGHGAYSLLTYTASSTGMHQIRAEGYPDNDLTGAYTLAVRQMGEDSVGATTGTATSTSIGYTFGFIETSGDADMYAVTLTAGQYYSFTLDGGIDYASEAVVPGEFDPVLTIYNSAGQQIAYNDDAGGDAGAAVSFAAEQSGTYYVRASSAQSTGGYALNIVQTDISNLDPLDSLDTGLFFSSTAITVYFAPGGTVYNPADPGMPDVTSLGWTQAEMDAVEAALQTYADVSNLTFSVTDNPNNATLRLFTTESDEFLGYFNFPQTQDAGIGVFARNGQGWTEEGLQPGGYGFVTLVHELGHALGLSHPHDQVGTSTPMPGVTGPFDSYGLFDLNQGIYTTMSYNDGWRLHPAGSPGSENYGWQAGPGALDIAVIQAHYGASTANTGDNVYVLPTTNAAGTFFDVIWDTGGTDSIVHNGTVTAHIDLRAATLDYSATGGGAISYVDGIYGGFTIANRVTIENATGGSGADIITGNAAANQLSGGGGNDTIGGGLGADTLIGGGGSDTFRGTAAELSGDRINDFASGDRIVISNATLSSFTHTLSGSTLTFSGGSLTFGSALSGSLIASAAPEGGVQLVLSNTPPPPPPAVSRARLILTESGQDLVIGGNVAVFGTSAGGEVIEIVRGDVTLDASFNLGGDTVVLPGNAGSYTAVLSGSFVTLSGGGLSVAIPVGTAGMAVQFANSTRTLEIEGGQVLLGTQQITTTAQAVAASGAALVDAVETGPDSLARLILTAPGQDVDVGGNVSIFGTTSPGEVVTVLGGDVRLDASFNAGGDTVALPGPAADYSASLSGSFVTITDGDMSVAIPVGVAGLTVDFADVNLTLRIDTATGQVMLGEDVVLSIEATAATLATLGMEAPFGDLAQTDIGPVKLDTFEPSTASLEIHSFNFG